MNSLNERILREFVREIKVALRSNEEARRALLEQREALLALFPALRSEVEAREEGHSHTAHSQ